MDSERRRSGKKRRIGALGLAAAAGCCGLATTALADGGVAARVTPGNAGRGALEARRRLQREYYRGLYEASSPSSAGGGVSAPRAGITSGNDETRRLGSMHHKKSSDGDSSEDDLPRQQPVQVGAASAPAAEGGSMTNWANTPAAAEPGEEDAMTTFTMLGGGASSEGADEESEPADAGMATDLRRFRSGPHGQSSGPSLPPDSRYPYMASLQVEGHSGATKFDAHVCGGALVAPDMVLTSAHCGYLDDRNGVRTQAFNGIEVGRSDLSDDGDAFDPYSLETYHRYYESLIADDLILHDSYDEDTYEHDLMLVKVHGLSRFPVVKLASGRVEAAPSDSVTVPGWGAVSNNSVKKFSDELRTAGLDLIRNDQCRAKTVEVKDPDTFAHSTMSLEDYIFEDMVCGMPSGGRYLCHGDAGSPAVVRGATHENDEAYGIVSWGYGCVDPSYPAVMTRVSTHYDWIKRTICSVSSDPPAQYGCIVQRSSLGGPKQEVSLKIRLDMMSVETGFVVKARDTGEVVAQRQPGYYKSKQHKNDIVVEKMDLSRNTCYTLTMLDEYGDGLCCDMGGGDVQLYWGSDVSYHTGHRLAEIKGNFGYDSSADFCLTSPADMIGTEAEQYHQSVPVYPAGSNVASNWAPNASPTNPVPVLPDDLNWNPTGSGAGQPVGGSGGAGGPPNPPLSNPAPQKGAENNSDASDINSTHHDSAWTGPVSSAEYDYCSTFCATNANGMYCGQHECVHNLGLLADDADQGAAAPDEAHEEEKEEPAAEVVTEYFDDDTNYHLTVHFRFDSHPDEVSWVLYDLTADEVKVFVDFDAYRVSDYANEDLSVVVNIAGPEAGQRDYAFTVYDRASDGLCCSAGDGYYKVYLGDEDDDYLMGDAEYEFSSSYYFTLFEEDDKEEAVASDAPTTRPTRPPTRAPTRPPTKEPTRAPTPDPTAEPTRAPTGNPTTARPTNPWERKRAEDADDIGQKWRTKSRTPPGVFNDVGGNQVLYRFDVEGAGASGAAAGTPGGAALVIPAFLAFIAAAL